MGAMKVQWIDSFLSKTCFFLVLFFLIPSLSYANSLSLGRDIPYFYYEDAKSILSFEDFLNIPDEELVRSQKIFSKGYTKSTFWIKASVSIKEFKDKEYWFEILPVFLDQVEFFYKPIGIDVGWSKRSAGDFNGKNNWDVDYKSPVFILPESPSGYDVVFKVSTTSAMLLEVKLWEEREFFSYELKDNAFWSFSFGLFLMTSLFSLLLACIFNKREYWSAFFFCSMYILVFCIQGYYSWLFESDYYSAQHYLVSVFSITSFSVLLWNCCELLGLYENSLVMFKSVLSISALILVQVLWVFFDQFLIATLFVYILFFIGSFLVVFSAFYCFFKLKFNVLYFLLMCSVLVLIGFSIARVFVLTAWIDYGEKGGGGWQVLIVLNVIVVIVMTSFKVYKEKVNAIEREILAKDLLAERDALFHQRMFVSMLSHEFRTSLAVISGALTNLKVVAGSSNEFLSKRYNRIERANERLIQLTDNCLADDRISSNEQVMNFAKENLVEIVEQVKKVVDISERHKLNFSLNGMPINFENFPDLYLNADAAMLQIAISNILGNAIKYMDEGDIDFEIITSQGNFIIKIEDHGPGIDSDYVNTIFDRYKRAVDAEGGRQRNGFGLGLYIAKRIVVAHGGDIKLIKNSNKGCCFELIIPNDFTGV
jgi:signal transduction histidine kinase